MQLNFFIVDDDPVCSQLYRQYLLNMGHHHVETFESADMCLARMTEQTPDIILIDHQLAPDTGLELLKNIKRQNPDIYVIYISGKWDITIASDAIRHGAFDVVIKGENDESDLRGIVHKIVIVRKMLTDYSAGDADTDLAR